MPQEAKDIDELEAMLAGLNQDELDQLDELDTPVSKPSTTVDDDISDAELIADLDVQAAAAVPKPPARKRRLKPLDSIPDPAPVAAVPSTATEDDDLAMLADLDEPEVNGEDDAQPVVAPADSPAKMNAAQLEQFAIEIIDLMTTLSQKYGIEEDDMSVILEPVLATITAESTLAEVEKQMVKLLDRRMAQIKLGDTPFEPEETAGPVSAPTAIVEEPAHMGAGPGVLTQEIAANIGKDYKEAMAKALESISDETDLGDAELDALLAAAPADPTPVATPTPTKPIAVTPTRKAGALNTFIDADKLQEDLKFTENSISLAMTRQAALFAHYARLSADATYQSDRAKQQVELLEAQLNQKFRDSLVAAGTKFTEKSIDAMVISDSSYQAAQERAHEARAIAKMVESATESFRHRKDMLIQVGADLRMEKQGELRMKEHPGQRAVGAM